MTGTLAASCACVYVCTRACVPACQHASVRACVHACVCVSVLSSRTGRHGQVSPTTAVTAPHWPGHHSSCYITLKKITSRTVLPNLIGHGYRLISHSYSPIKPAQRTEPTTHTPVTAADPLLNKRSKTFRSPVERKSAIKKLQHRTAPTGNTTPAI